jgi:excisionase family DNA binding protein
MTTQRASFTPPPRLARDYLTRTQAAVELGCSLRELDRKLAAGSLDFIPYDGKHRLISKKSVNFYIAERSGLAMPEKANGRQAKA